jgi:hypothetical protein
MPDLRYRKISVRIWNDEKVRKISDDGKLAFVFVLTHPLMTGIGAARLSVPGLSAELGWNAEKGSKAFREAFREGLLEYDDRACLLWAPNFLRHNKPESPNVVRSWLWIPSTLPDCQLKVKVFQSVKAFTEGLGEAFAKALPEAFREGLGLSYNTEQRTYNKEQLEELSSAPADPCPPVVELFHATCKDLPAVKQITPQRRSAIIRQSKTLKDMAEWELFFESVQSSDFLCGRNGSTWRATFDWILKPANFIKIQEGNYVNRTAGTTGRISKVGGVNPGSEYDGL